MRLPLLGALAALVVADATDPTNNCSALALAGAFTPYVLRNANGVEAHFVPFGAALQRLYVPDATGTLRDVVLGYDDPQVRLPCPLSPDAVEPASS